MKNLVSFKIGKEKIEMWQVFISVFLLLMFFVCMFLGYGFLSSAHNNVQVNEEESVDDLAIITDFSKINKDNYSESSINYYYKDYKKYISDNNGSLKLDNIEVDLYSNINTSVYRVNLNKNGWFLFNNISNDFNDLNEFYVLDTDLNFHKVNYQINSFIKDYTEDPLYENFEIGDFNFFYNKKNDYFYGYKSISDHDDCYFVLSGEKFRFNTSDYEKLFKEINNNINITIDKTYKTTGLKLSEKYENIKLDDNTSLDLYTNVSIVSLTNGIKSNPNVIDVMSKNTLNTMSIKEINKSIDNYSKGNKKNGYLQYKYKDSKIYLKYNLKDYPDFNYSEGGINGVLIDINGKTLLIQFDKTYTFTEQDELDKVLNTTIGEIIN